MAADKSADPDLAGRLGLGALPRPKFTRGQWLWIAAGVVAALIGLRMQFGAAPPVVYLSQPVTRGDLVMTVSATGTLAPRDQVDVGAEVSGRIDAVLVDFNDHVKKGEKLARINTLNFEAALAQSRAGLAQAQATLVQAAQVRTRTAALLRSGAASRQAIDSANADLLRAQAGVRLAAAQVNSNQTTLAKATIYSPIDGVVLDRKVSAGQTVVAAMTTPVLFTLASDLSQMELDVDIDEADVGLLRAGTKATFTVDAYPMRRFAAKLVSIHNAPKTVQGVVTYQGVLLVENREGLLKPGMTATAELDAADIRGVVLVANTALRFVPPDAVKNAAPPPPAPQAGIVWGRVWIKDGATIVPRDVRLGASNGRSTVVLAGNLKPGDAAVTEIQGHPWQSKPSSPFGSVTKVYGTGEARVVALGGIDLDIADGEFVAVMGPSGSGKSTTMNILGCLDTPTGGHYYFRGADVGAMSKDQLALLRRHYLGFVFQGFNLLKRTTAIENLELPLIYRNVPRAERRRRALATLQLVGLGDRAEHTAAELSGGQQQRVAIARALVTDPSVMFADEPTGNLDSAKTHEIMQLLKSLNAERGLTIVLVTHEEDVAAYAKRQIRFLDGRIASDTGSRP